MTQQTETKTEERFDPVDRTVLEYKEPIQTQERLESSLEQMWGKLPMSRFKNVGRVIYLPVTDNATAPTVGDSAYSFTVPSHLDGAVIERVEAAVTSTSASGGPILVQLAIGSNDLLSTRINIDDGEKHSRDAATQPVINRAYATLRESDQIDVDIDDIGDGNAFGLQVYIYVV